MKIAASAPGKLVLIGEYAVLEGSPAVVMAADRRAEALIETSMLDHNAVETSSADGGHGYFVFDSNGELDWKNTQHGLIPRFKLISDVMEFLFRRIGVDHAQIPHFNARLMTMDFFRRNGATDRKLGLGSSAALTVAFASAFASYIGQGFRVEDKKRWLKELLAAHRFFQMGVGSGLDVAASLYGGVISYVMGRSGEPQVRRLRLPESLKILCIWTGEAASTSQFLKKIEDWKEHNPGQYRDLIGSLGKTAARGASALEQDDAAAFIDEIRQFAVGLKAVDEAGDIGIFSDEHRELSELAASCGVAYKPCGAGGGDIGIACSTDDDALLRLDELVEAKGYRKVSLKVDPNGLEISSVQE